MTKPPKTTLFSNEILDYDSNFAETFWNLELSEEVDENNLPYINYGFPF